MTKEDTRRRIEELGIIPSIRGVTAEDALFAAEAVRQAEIPILEINLTAPEAVEVVAHVAQKLPEVIVGAGGMWDIEGARRCLAAGAKFLTSDGLDLDTMRFAVQQDVVVIPGILTPSELIAAWKMGPDLVKVVPCGHIGGETYIRALKAMFPRVPLMAAGGVNQRTASFLVRAGAVALGIGRELIPRGAIRQREAGQIAELARRFLLAVSRAREEFADRTNQTAAT